jgi:hypothetical protein
MLINKQIVIKFHVRDADFLLRLLEAQFINASVEHKRKIAKLCYRLRRMIQKAEAGAYRQ